ncbi:MAG: hypothetical protein M0030_18615 [Actinomycetota bacterium]|nr:hypothetical protein [Actinomycetota bacterium]
MALAGPRRVAAGVRPRYCRVPDLLAAGVRRAAVARPRPDEPEAVRGRA